ncbi:MAG TPA: EamA family transporter [Prolixibacteraceae bacterium]|jgi:drug/metabolite transporter (DMT)-like permease|nr:EamA family transporter [Prolixibacteraceae bacterium]
MKLKQLMYFIVPCIIWGSTWFAIKFQLGQVDPLVSVVYRFLIAGLLLMAFSMIRKLNLRYTFQEHLRMMLQGVILFGFNYWFVYLAETHLASGIVAIIFSFSIFTNIFFNYLLLKGKIKKEVMAGAVLGIAGTWLIFNHEFNNSAQIALSYNALMFCLGSIVLASLGNILSKYNQTRKLPVIQTNAFSMTYGSLAMMLMVPLSGRSFSFEATFPYIASLLYLSLFGSIVAFTLYLKLVGDIGPDRAGYTTLVAPVIALVISSFFENYQWGIVAAFGVVLLFAGNILALKMKTLKPSKV